MSIPKSIKEQISKNDPNVTHLDLYDQGLNDNDIEELQELLQNNSHITSLNLSGNVITAIGCQFLRLIPALKKVDLSSCHMGDKGIPYLLQTKIEFLNLSSCGLTKEGAELLLKNIEQFKSLDVGRNPNIPEMLVYQIHKKFIPRLSEPGSNLLPPGVGIDLGLNIHCSSSGDDNHPVEVIFSSEKPFEKKQGEAKSIEKFGLRRSSQETLEPGSPPTASSSLDDTVRFLSKLPESEYSEVLRKAQEMRAQQASRQKLISSK